MPFTTLKPNGIDLSQTFAFTGSVSGAGGGKLLQTVQVVNKNSVSYQLATGSITSCLTASITPSATSSKILIRFDIYLGTQNNTCYPYVVLRRGTTDIYKGNSSGSRQRATGGSGFVDGNKLQCLSNEFLDSPNTTSSTDYVVNVGGFNNVVFYLNHPDDNNNQQSINTSQITLMEIGA